MEDDLTFDFEEPTELDKNPSDYGPLCSKCGLNHRGECW